MKNEIAFYKKYANEQLRRSKHPARRLIKYFYINNVLKDVIGPSLDVGCGTGQLLSRLPPDSLGLELNPFLINELTKLGLNVRHCDMTKGDFQFSGVSPGQFNTLIISYVLEHFNNATDVMRKIFKSANTLGVNKIIIIVPGQLGYMTDKTHQTFINMEYIQDNDLDNIQNYKLEKKSYFPTPHRSFDKFFIYQKLKLVYEKK